MLAQNSIISRSGENILARITEPSKDDYNNVGSDNCDYNFDTFDDFGVKNDPKVSHDMILMSRYKGQLHGGKRGHQILTRSPPRSDNAWKKLFLPGEVLPYFFYPYFLWLPLATNIYYRK